MAASAADAEEDGVAAMLPLDLIKAEVIPPAPNRSASAADFLPDFAGLSWMAYGASSLLVVSHLPSPNSEDETAIGPVFRQVIEPPRGRSEDVKAVAWAPVLPSNGEVAAASGRDVRVYSSPVGDSNGSFCWRQIAGLAHSSPVEAVKWTGSGDGMVAAGVDVTWWRRNNDCWEALWKSKVDFLQTLVSTSWSVAGLSATAASWSSSLVGESSYSLEEARKCVYVYWNEGKTGFMKADLCHPQPISMIQWRPSVLKTKANDPRRDLLLTCCLDGAVRLWSEIDHRKPKKHGADLLDQKPWKSFHVVAVVEMSHSLKGTLGLDIFVVWATEVREKGSKQCFTTEDFELNSVGWCEWLIGVGPGTTLTFWAVHCLDDLMPLRFPRVTLWKKQDLVDLGYRCRMADNLGGSQEHCIVKAILSRSEVFGPPTMVSLVQPMPKNLICWSRLRISKSHNADISSENQFLEENFLFSFRGNSLTQEGHRGKILQIAIHPCHEVEMAVSLDSNGTLLFWSLSPNSTERSSTLFQPTWKLLGRIELLSEGVVYTALRWAPSLFHNNPLLLLGHAGGIDFIIITFTESEVDEIGYHKVCTFPFVNHGQRGAPDHIYATFAPCTKEHNMTYGTFLLWSMWTKNFLALPWKIVLHEGDLATIFNSSRYANYTSSFSSRKYYVTVDLCPSVFPDSNDVSQITSYTVICSDSSAASIQEDNSVYQLATGFTNGSVKLWRASVMADLDSDPESLPFELVGVLHLHQSPITSIAVSSCGRKIAAISNSEDTCVTYLHLWESKYLATEGRFVLEDKINIDGVVIALEWLNLGNGSLLLGVCLEEKLLIYAPKRLVCPDMAKGGRHFGLHAWICVAVGQGACTIRGFQWGPKVAPLIIHDTYFGLFNQWASSAVRNEIIMDGAGDECGLMKSSVKMNESCCCNVSSLGKIYDPNAFHKLHNIIEIVETLSGPLPVYHPISLMHFLSSGNFKRAYSAMELLLKQLSSCKNSEVQRKNAVNNFYQIIPSVDLALYSEANFSLKIHKEDVKQVNNISSAHNKQYDRKTFHWGVYSMDTISREEDFTVSTSKEGMFSSAIEEFLRKNTINNLDKEQLLASADILDEITNSCSSTYDSFDEPSRRFWVAAQYQQKYLTRKYGRISTLEERAVDTGLMAWALHSDCQHQLLDSLLSSEPSWAELKIFGVGYWFTDMTQLRTRMEKIARSQYLKKKDPKDCILLYLVLNRLQVLFGLFKLSKDEKDKPLVRFLSRNFQEERNKAAALKNAYVLMGKHQLELAIAFFLLGGDPSSAVNICAKNFGDEQLALVICRLLEGYGGPLEHQLILNSLLPNALEKRDYWLASLLEWLMGNYSKSFWNLFYSQMDIPKLNSTILDNYMVFLDPNIGQYCTLLASKNSMKNLAGDVMSSLMARWGASTTSIALKRCGLFLEALDFCASSSCTMEEKDQDMPLEIRNSHKSNWITKDVAYHLELAENLALSLQYMSRLVKEHPKWPNCQLILSKDCNDDLFEQKLEVFKNSMQIGISTFQKYLVEPHDVLLLLFTYVCNRGSWCLALCIFHNYISQCQLGKRYQILLPKLIMNSIVEANLLLCRYIFSCSTTLCPLMPSTRENRSIWLCPWVLHLPDLVVLVKTLGSLVMLYDSNFVSALVAEKIHRTFSLVEYCAYFASAWFERDIKMINLMMQPIFNMLMDGHDLKIEELLKLLDQVGKIVFPFSSYSVKEGCSTVIVRTCLDEQSESMQPSLPEDKRWHIVATFLWSYFSKFFTNSVSTLCQGLEDGESVPLLLKHIFSFISVFLTKQLKLYLTQKTENGLPVPTLVWLREVLMGMPSSDCLAKSSASHQTKQEELTLLFENLWKASADSELLCEGFLKEITDDICSDLQLRCWAEVYENIRSLSDNADGSVCTQSRSTNGSRISENGMKGKSFIFHSPKEVYLRNGELLEGMSVNSIDQKQVAVATNRKGLVFFDLTIEEPSKERTAYIWLESDWPHNGWAGTKSTPMPTVVSPGIGLVSTKKGTHYGLGGATVGKWSRARPGRDLTGGGAFGIPGYAGIGASGLGWGESEDFDGFVDPSATVENISSRSLSSHPSRSLFLVGSQNTYMYLWEFGKAKATATYGVLPAANVPPPYAIASVSSLQFDRCGHRFASGALDGIVCTWLLEVGGRSDVYPTESSLCFSDHTSDVAYAAASGSIIAAAGSSGNGANIVLWDTLAPPSSSQASIICHEGGARSLSVFDNDIGSGSVSPMIVSGGRGGDVCLHDFRFIATGKSKRHKQSTLYYEDNSVEQKSPNGMLWYIPKAHQGSIMKIATIPNTSLFLTGGKDGDVKLWDAKNRELVFQWQKLHERHTFLQPSSRGFGGIVRAAVTDIQVISRGFITCGGDGMIKLVHLGDFGCKT